MSSVDSTAESRDGSPALSDDTPNNHRSTPKEGTVDLTSFKSDHAIVFRWCMYMFLCSMDATSVK